MMPSDRNKGVQAAPKTKSDFYPSYMKKETIAERNTYKWRLHWADIQDKRNQRYYRKLLINTLSIFLLVCALIVFFYWRSH